MWDDQCNGGALTSPPLNGTEKTDNSSFWNFEEQQPTIGNSSQLVRVETPNSEEMSDCDAETVLTADMSCSPALTATQSHDDDSSHDFEAPLQFDSTNRSQVLPFQPNFSKKENKMGNLPQINEKKPTTPLLPSLSPSRSTSIQKRTLSRTDDAMNIMNNNPTPHALSHNYASKSIMSPTDVTSRAAALLSDKPHPQVGRNSHSWINSQRTPSGRAWNSTKQDSTQLSFLSSLPQNYNFGDQSNIEMYKRNRHNPQHNSRQTPPFQYEPNLKAPHYLHNNFPYNLQPRPTSQQQATYHSRSNVNRGSFPIQSPASPNLKPIGSPHTTFTQRSPSPPSPVSMTGPPPLRSPPEILKTLLRKKACLYEPGTSRAIALITWHVGRNLALNSGYFSRQHLQLGVHNVVAEKIKSGIITRTKVNRCMQIILNSCFHYIIPRPDGSEERGSAFRKLFSETAVEDSFLLKHLPAPWHDLKFKFDDFTQSSSFATATQDEDNTHETEKAKKGKDKDTTPPNKRPVLLCFNENVRSAGDILRCHNEFIRDAAYAANLELTAEDWKNFFLGEDDDASNATEGTIDTTLSEGPAVHSPEPEYALPDSVVAQIISFESDHLPLSSSSSTNNNIPEYFNKNFDVLGQMNYSELSKFRTTWCCKRYDHDPFRCRFAHVDINGGWLRRDPLIFQYEDKLCPHILRHINKHHTHTNTTKKVLINKCPLGLRCKYAHSMEEIEYHPKRYKKSLCDCNNFPTEQVHCELKDICPHLHPISQPKSSSQGGHAHRSRYLRQNIRETSNHTTLLSGGGSNISSNNNNNGATAPSSSTQTKTETSVTSGNSSIPQGSPMLYLNPAPKSGFDDHLMFPGLRDLFRRNCLVFFTNASSNIITDYTLFGDFSPNTVLS